MTTGSFWAKASWVIKPNKKNKSVFFIGSREF